MAITSPATTKAAFVSQVMRELNARRLNKMSGPARLSEVLRRIQRVREYDVVSHHQAMVAYAIAWSVQSLRLNQEPEQALIAMSTRQLVSLIYDLSKICETQIDVTYRLNEQFTPKVKGSFLDNGIAPEQDMKVWARVGWDCSEVVNGTIALVTNIDNRGLANTYVDLTANGRSYHCNVNLLYDHQPRKVEIVDCYGPVQVWQ